MDTSRHPSDLLRWGNLGSVRPFPDFRPGQEVADLQAAVEQKDINTLVGILTSRSNDQRQVLKQAYLAHTKQELKAGLKKVLSGDLEALILALMMTPLQFEAHRLRQAMEGVGTDEETLLEVLCTRTPNQLSDITTVYNREYKRDLEKDLISETSGDFTKLLVALLKKEYGARSLEEDIRVLSEELNSKKADAGPWIRIFTSGNPGHLRNVLIGLEAEKEKPVAEIIEKHFGGILWGDFRLGLQTLVRCIENPYLFLAQRIQSLKGSVLQGVMVSHSEEDLLAVRVAYKTHTGTSLYTALQVGCVLLLLNSLHRSSLRETSSEPCWPSAELRTDRAAGSYSNTPWVAVEGFEVVLLDVMLLVLLECIVVMVLLGDIEVGLVVVEVGVVEVGVEVVAVVVEVAVEVVVAVEVDVAVVVEVDVAAAVVVEVVLLVGIMVVVVLDGIMVVVVVLDGIMVVVLV
ncbi:hypothetical protein NFI96_018209 [Prochilodus magdalenae]|nr:hypothetical protein NFI96_018209 [Prochilodus magdalenae]